jgi:predicted PurR-regulated permease PerM
MSGTRSGNRLAQIAEIRHTLNPVLVFFALIGSLFVFGLSGLFLGPFILIFSAAVFNHQRAPEI